MLQSALGKKEIYTFDVDEDAEITPGASRI